MLFINTSYQRVKHERNLSMFYSTRRRQKIKRKAVNITNKEIAGT